MPGRPSYPGRTHRHRSICSLGMSCRDIAGCPGPPPQHHFQQAAPGQLQILLRTRTADCRARKRRKTLRHYHCMSRSDLLARTDCGPSAAALSSRCRYAHQWESISCWIYAAAQPGDTSYRHLRRARRRRRRQGRCLFPRRIDKARRPLPVADRTRFGDREADMVCASRAKAHCSVAGSAKVAFCCRPGLRTRCRLGRGAPAVLV